MLMFLTIIHGGNYSSEETIQRRKLFKGGNYMRKYGIHKAVSFQFFFINS